MSTTPEIQTQVAVVGSGPGGATTAALLADAGQEVLILDSGPWLKQGDVTPFSIDEMEQTYRYGGVTATLGSPKIAYVEANCVGGGSEINAGLYHRTPDEVLTEWGNRCLLAESSPESMRPHFEACEKALSVQRLSSGVPLASQRLDEGARQLGWASIDVPRCVKDVGGSLVRQSMSETYLPTAVAAGAKVLPAHSVERLIRTGSRWRLQSRDGDVLAEKVFLSAGAIQTPLILRKSGIKRNVGNHLSVHATIKLVARFDEPVNSGVGVPVHQIKEFSPRLSFGGSISAPPYVATALLDHPDALRRSTEEWPLMAVYYAMIRGGGGTVRRMPFSGDPFVRYQLNKSDIASLCEGVAKLAEALFAAGAVEVFPSIQGWPKLTRSTDLKKLPATVPAGRLNLMTIHLVGTCAAGERTDLCVADSFGRVHAARNLYVADASLLGGAPGVNPQGSIMAFARRNALKYLDAQ